MKTKSDVDIDLNKILGVVELAQPIPPLFQGVPGEKSGGNYPVIKHNLDKMRATLLVKGPIKKHPSDQINQRPLSPLESILTNFGDLKPIDYKYTSRGYLSSKLQVIGLTQPVYMDGVSRRLLIAKDWQDRRQLPLIVIDLDGVFGFWDEQKVYSISERAISILAGLSQNFRLAVFSVGKTKNQVVRLLKQL